MLILLLNQELKGEAEFSDLAAVTGQGSTEDFVGESEIAV